MLRAEPHGNPDRNRGRKEGVRLQHCYNVPIVSDTEWHRLAAGVDDARTLSPNRRVGRASAKGQTVANRRVDPRFAEISQESMWLRVWWLHPSHHPADGLVRRDGEIL